MQWSWLIRFGRRFPLNPPRTFASTGVHQRRSQFRFQLPISRRKPRDPPKLQIRIQPLRPRRIFRILLRPPPSPPRLRYSHTTVVTRAGPRRDWERTEFEREREGERGGEEAEA